MFLCIHTVNYQSFPPTNWYIDGGVDEWWDQYDEYCRMTVFHEGVMDKHEVVYPYPTYTAVNPGWDRSVHWVHVMNPVEILPT